MLSSNEPKAGKNQAPLFKATLEFNVSPELASSLVAAFVAKTDEAQARERQFLYEMVRWSELLRQEERKGKPDHVA
jgi:hypothetical protein